MIMTITMIIVVFIFMAKKSNKTDNGSNIKATLIIFNGSMVTITMREWQHNPLRWRHNGCDSVSNDQPRECLLRRAHQRKHQSSASLAFVRGIHRRPVNSPHKWPVTRKMFPFDDVIMFSKTLPVLISTVSLEDVWPSTIQCNSIYLMSCKAEVNKR